jgi:TRAP-type uncharacterized transport system substrate-binding protein
MNRSGFWTSFSVCGLLLLGSRSAVGQISKQGSAGPQAVPEATRPEAGRGLGKSITTEAQIRHILRQETNSGLVGIISGALEGTNRSETADLAISLDGDDLRILPVVGKGALQNVTDIIFARGIDMGIIQLDVLEALRRDPPFPGIERYLQYIARLYDEELHILAGNDIHSIEELVSKKVNFGIRDSGTSMTATAIFGKLGLKVEVTNFPSDVALEKLRQGEISALAYVAAKPTRLFQVIRPEENLHFLSIPPAIDAGPVYTPTTIRAEDYPELVEQGKPISTLAVGTILAVYNWPPGTDRYRKVSHFVQAFFDHLDDFRTPPHHFKWRDVNIAISVPGWTRFAPAEEMIRKVERSNEAPTVKSARASASSNEVARFPGDLDALFTEFLAFQQRHAATANGDGSFDLTKLNALFSEFMEYHEREADEVKTLKSLGAGEPDVFAVALAHRTR